MNYRQLGRTKLQVSEIGFGAWGIGKSMWIGAEDDESYRALHQAADLGLNFVDTAFVYGNGHSEQLVGKFARERREEIIIATKVPPKNYRWPAQNGIPIEKTFPAGHITASVGKSLRNLRVEHIDLLQFHVWNDEWLSSADWYEAVARLKREGAIRFFGVSINDHEPDNALELIKTGLVDSVQVIFNVFDQAPLQALFPACVEHNIGVIVRVPLDEGGLTGKITPATQFPQGDFRNKYFRDRRKEEVSARVRALEPVCQAAGASLPELALRFCLAFDAVSTVIPGMRSTAHARENCQVSGREPLSSEALAALAGHAWLRNFYQ